MNIWYLCSKIDRRKKFGYRVITKYGHYHSTILEAKEEAKKYKGKIVILKRTCQPLSRVK